MRASARPPAASEPEVIGLAAEARSPVHFRVAPRARTATALALCIGSGVLYGVAFPPTALRPLAWIALVPLLVAIRRSSLPRALALGALWACVMTYVTSDCLPGAVINYYKQSPAVGWLMLLGATVVTMVPYYGSFAGVYWLLARRPGALLPLLAAAAWVAAELGRVTVLGGNPWAVSGYSQTGFLPIMQVADLGGVHLVGFVLLVVNATIAEGFLAYAFGSVGRRTVLRAAALATAVVVVALGYGFARLDGAFLAPAGPSVPIAIAQGNLDLGRQWRRDMYGKNLDDYLRLTYEATRSAAPRLVFWPESAMTFFLLDEPAYRAALARVLGPANVELIAGGPRATQDTSGGGRYFNATFLVAPDGRVLGWQDKLKLLPFAEYFPLESIDLLRRDFGRATQFTPGDAQPPLPSVAGGAGVVVCNESMYPELARERVAAGAAYLVNPANDSWFGALKYSLQAFDIARWRAVETRRYLVRTSTAGPSGVVDPWGRVLVATEAFTRGWVAGEVRPSSHTTLYQRFGDLFAVACLTATLLACALAAARPRP